MADVAAAGEKALARPRCTAKRTRHMRLAVLASHEGTTLEAVLDACRAGALAASVSLVISNNSSSGALRRARAAGVAALHLSSATHPEPAALERAILEALGGAGVEVVLLAGYLKKLGPGVLHEYRGRVLNTHPSLLPRYSGAGMYGRRVYEAVLAAGDTETGASIHLVDPEYDTGAVIARCCVPVRSGDTLEILMDRVQAQERKLVVDTLVKLCEEGFARSHGSGEIAALQCR